MLRTFTVLLFEVSTRSFCLKRPHLSKTLCIQTQSTYFQARSMSGEPGIKKKCLKIGTHNGSFHCDEVLACFILKQLKQYKDAEIVRTRDPKELETCDIVVDVGGVYDPSKHRYDHHQRSFSETMNSLDSSKQWVTKLSSAGLVYFHFGLEVVSSILDLPKDDPVSSTIFDMVYENFMEEIDAIDNGVNQADSELRYRITTNLSARVARLNPKWNESNVDENAQFEKAMVVAGAEFLERVQGYLDTWLPARDIVVKALKNRHETDPSGKILTLQEGGCPWREHLFTLEAEMDVSPPILYVLYPDNNSHWRVQCVPVKLGSFESRLPLKENWRGVRDEDLSTKTGIKGCIFVHASGFIGGNKTYEGALEMARQTIGS